MVLGLLVVAGVLVTAAARAAWLERSRRRFRGAFWWRLIGAPLAAEEPGATMLDALWRLVRGASGGSRPGPSDIGRRYVDLLADNLGQPGFREVLLAVHDLDARAIWSAASSTAEARAAFGGRRAGPRPARSGGPGLHRGAGRALWSMSCWAPCACRSRRRRTRRRSRPRATGAGSCIICAIVPTWPGGCSTRCRRRRGAGDSGRPGALAVRSARIAAARRRTSVRASARSCGRSRRPRSTTPGARALAAVEGAFVVRPVHNPIGPFDFAGVYDEASDRRCSTVELISRGTTMPTASSSNRSSPEAGERHRDGMKTATIRKPTSCTAARVRATGATPLTTPIYATSTFVFENAAALEEYQRGTSDRYIYSRYANPRCRRSRQKLAVLEGAETALVTSSGMAATATALFGLLQAGRRGGLQRGHLWRHAAGDDEVPRAIRGHGRALRRSRSWRRRSG